VSGPAAPPDQAAQVRVRLARRLGADAVEITHGWSGSAVHRLERHARADLFLKQTVDPADVADEAARLVWLADTDVDCPEVIDAGPGWMLTSALAGRDAAEPWPAELRSGVLDAMADTLLALHALDPFDCPFQTRYPAHPLSTGRVVTHGDFCCPNVFVHADGRRPAGVLDVGWLGVADAYVDLATTVMTLTRLNPQYGGRSAAQRVFDRYGADLDDPRVADYLAFYDSAP